MADSVLLIDDDADVLRTVGTYFERVGWEVARELDGEAGLAAYDRLRPEVVILDLHLPGLDGLEVLSRLRERNAAVILLTGQGDVPTAVKAMQLGAENFLTKPVDMGHLAATVEKAAEKNQLRRENVELRARLTPSLKRQIVRWSAVVALLVASVLVGKWIGGDKNVRPTVPIPVPIDSTPR